MEQEDFNPKSAGNQNSNYAVLRLERKLAQCEAKRKAEKKFYNEYIKNMKARYLAKLEVLEKSQKDLLVQTNEMLERCNSHDPQIRLIVSLFKSKYQDFSRMPSRVELSHIPGENNKVFNMMDSSDSLMLSMAESMKPKENHSAHVADRKFPMHFHPAKSYNGLNNLTLTESEVVGSNPESLIRMSKNSTNPALIPSPKSGGNNISSLQRADTTQSVSVETPLEIKEIESKLSDLLGSGINMDLNLSQSNAELEESKLDRESKAEFQEKVKSEQIKLNQESKTFTDKVEMCIPDAVTFCITAVSKANDSPPQGPALKKCELSQISESIGENVRESQATDGVIPEEPELTNSKLIMQELARATRTISELELAHSEQLGKIEEMTMEKETLEADLQSCKRENEKLRKDIEEILRTKEQEKEGVGKEKAHQGVGSVQFDMEFDDSEMHLPMSAENEGKGDKRVLRPKETEKQSKAEEKYLMESYEEEMSHQAGEGGSHDLAEKREKEKRSHANLVEEEKNKEIRELEQIKAALQKEEREHLETKEKLREALEKEKNLGEEIEASRSTNAKERQTRENEHKELNQKLIVLKEEVTNLKETFKNQEKENLRLQKAIKEQEVLLTNEKAAHKQGLEDSNKKVQKLEEENREMEETRKQQDETAKTREGQLENLRKEVEKERERVGELENEVRQLADNLNDQVAFENENAIGTTKKGNRPESMGNARKSKTMIGSNMGFEARIECEETEEILRREKETNFSSKNEQSAEMKDKITEELREEIKRLLSEKEKLQEEILEWKQKASKLEEALANLEKQLPKQTTSSRKPSGNGAFSQDLSTLEETICSQRIQLAEIQEKFCMAMSENESLKKQCHLMDDDLLRDSEMIQNLTETIAKLKNQANSIESNATEKKESAQTQDSNGTIKRLEEEKRTMERRLGIKESELDSARKELNALGKEKERLHIELGVKETEFHQKDEMINQFQRQLALLQKQEKESQGLMKKMEESFGNTAYIGDLERSLEGKNKELVQIIEELGHVNSQAEKTKEQLAGALKENESIKSLKETINVLERELRAQKGEVKRLKGYCDESKALKDLEERIEMERSQRSALEKNTVELLKSKDQTISRLKEEMNQMGKERYEGAKGEENTREEMLKEEIRHLEKLIQMKDEEMLAYIEMDHGSGTHEFGDPDEEDFQLSELVFKHLLTKYVKLQRMMKTIKKEIRHREKENRIHELERLVKQLENEKRKMEEDKKTRDQFKLEPISPSNASMVSTKSLFIGPNSDKKRRGKDQRNRRPKSLEEELKEKVYFLEAKLKVETEDHERHKKNHEAEFSKRILEARAEWEAELAEHRHQFERELNKLEKTLETEKKAREEARSAMVSLEKELKQMTREGERKDSRIKELQNSNKK